MEVTGEWMPHSIQQMFIHWIHTKLRLWEFWELLIVSRQNGYGEVAHSTAHKTQVGSNLLFLCTEDPV